MCGGVGMTRCRCRRMPNGKLDFEIDSLATKHVFSIVAHKVSETSTLRDAPHTKSRMTRSPTLIWLSAFFR